MKSQHAMTVDVSIDNILGLIRQLPPRDRRRLFALALPELEREFPKSKMRPSKRESLYGLWKHYQIDLTAEDIDEARREMWANFPRTDLL